MSIFYERRNASRLECSLGVWFAEGVGKTLFFGEMTSISNQAVAILCRSDKKIPAKNRKVTVYFDVPHIGGDSEDLVELRCSGYILRSVCSEDRLYTQIIIKFDRPLLFDPEKLNRLNLLFLAGPENYICQTLQ